MPVQQGHVYVFVLDPAESFTVTGHIGVIG